VTIAQTVLSNNIASRRALQTKLVNSLGVLHSRAQSDYQLADKECALIQDQLNQVIAAGG
jgi:hypothetical protein